MEDQQYFEPSSRPNNGVDQFETEVHFRRAIGRGSHAFHPCFRLDKDAFKAFVEQLTEGMGKPFNIVSELLILAAMEVQPLGQAAILPEIKVNTYSTARHFPSAIVWPCLQSTFFQQARLRVHPGVQELSEEQMKHAKHLAAVMADPQVEALFTLFR